MFTPIRVTQTYTLPDGTAPDPTAWVAFTPTAPLTDTSTEVDVSASTVTAHLDSSGRLRDPHDAGVGVVLYANDDPTTTPTGTAYRVLEHLTRQADRTYYVVVPALAPGGTIALAALAPAGGVPPVVWGLTRVVGSPHTPVTTAAGVATLADAPTGVTAGTYTHADITVDAGGYITAASDGTGGGGVGLSSATPLPDSGAGAVGADADAAHGLHIHPLSSAYATAADVTGEAAARIAGDATNAAALSAEATTRAGADTTLQTNLTSEASTRATADTALQTNITAEATARAGADSTEASARAAGDALALLKAQNLADLASTSTARANLGLGDSATRNVGTSAGTVAAGDDARFGAALFATATNSADFTAVADTIHFLSSSHTVTLPSAAATAGHFIILVNSGGSAWTVQRGGADTIELSSASYALAVHNTLWLQPLGTDWQVMSRKLLLGSNNPSALGALGPGGGPGSSTFAAHEDHGHPQDSFLNLSDQPGSYTGMGGYHLRVNGAETGIEFVSPATDPAPSTETTDFMINPADASGVIHWCDTSGLFANLQAALPSAAAVIAGWRVGFVLVNVTFGVDLNANHGEFIEVVSGGSPTIYTLTSLGAAITLQSNGVDRWFVLVNTGP